MSEQTAQQSTPRTALVTGASLTRLRGTRCSLGSTAKACGRVAATGLSGRAHAHGTGLYGPGHLFGAG